jgi:penicillin G amidase
MKTNIAVLIIILLIVPSMPTQVINQSLGAARMVSIPTSETQIHQTMLFYKNWSCTIVRDSYGVPHVIADTKEELAFGVGYALAEDRLWQADLFRREATGRLSEIGIGNASIDHWIRIHGYTVEENTQLFSMMQSPYKEMMVAYVEGMNQYINEAIANPNEKLPHEYLVRGITPEPWTVEDSLSIGQLMVRRWGEGGGMELIFVLVLQQLIQRNGIINGWRIFNDACPQIDPGAATTIQSNDTDDISVPSVSPPILSLILLESAQYIVRMKQLERQFCESQGLLYYFGSNGWVVAPEKSETGNALLLGGPQMGHSIPQIVAEVGMHGAGINASGMTFPGAGPIIAIGANTYGAWTTTSGLSDGVDTYIEILHPFDKTRYLFNGRWQKMENRTEVIYDKNGTPSQFYCYRTIHGPVLDIRWRPFIGGIAVSSKMAFWKHEHQTIEGVMSFQHCTNITAFEQGVRKIVSSHNWFWADRNGDIGYYHSGYYPIRPSHGFLHRRIDDRFPLLGTGKEEWLGIVPFEDLPQQRNPSRGFFANWNNKPERNWTHAEAEVGPLWGEGHIVVRIQELLAANPSISFQDMIDICQNVAYHDAYGTYFKPFLQHAINHSSGIPLEVKHALEAWDCYHHDHDADGFYDEPGLTIFHAWYDALFEKILLEKLSIQVKEYCHSLLLHILQGDSSKLQLRYKHYLYDTLDTVIIDALHQALDTLEAQYQTTDVSLWLTPVKMKGFSELGSLASPVMPYMNRGTYNLVVELSGFTKEQTEAPIGVSVLPPGQSGFVNAQGNHTAFAYDQLPLYTSWVFKEMHITAEQVPGNEEK